MSNHRIRLTVETDRYTERWVEHRLRIMQGWVGATHSVEGGLTARIAVNLAGLALKPCVLGAKALELSIAGAVFAAQATRGLSGEFGAGVPMRLLPFLTFLDSTRAAAASVDHGTQGPKTSGKQCASLSKTNLAAPSGSIDSALGLRTFQLSSR
jgi:hypothetical protein